MNKLYICEDCVVIFQIHSSIKRNKPYCPNCGERFDIRRYKAERTDKNSKVKLRWNEEELNLLHKCINGELEPHQVAIMTGRTINSILKKAGRVKKHV